MVLLLAQVIKRGITIKEGEQTSGILDTVSGESIKELQELAADCLAKAGLTELNDKLQNFQIK